MAPGKVTLLFGRQSGFTAAIDLASLDDGVGLQINGIHAGDQSGFSVASAGDFNRDGRDDLVIGAPGADPGGDNEAGVAFVVFGQADFVTSSISLASLDGMNGFRVMGIDPGDRAGASVSSAGDMNGDGFDDVILGAPNADPNGNVNAGEMYVVFGNGNCVSTVNLEDLDGSNGFSVEGNDADDHTGQSVSGAGDVDGDGLGDVVAGAFGAEIDENTDEDDGETYFHLR